MSLFISNAWAQSSGSPAGGGLELILMMGVFFAIMYFMIIRPQQKRAKEHKTMLASLNKGDEVVTGGGMLGKITKIDENFLQLEISEGVQIKVQKNAVSSIMPKGTLKGA